MGDTDIDSGETHQRKKLIINKRRKELISVTETKKTKPWDGDLRVSTAPQSHKNVGTSGDLKAASETEGIRPSTPLREAASGRTYLCPTCGVFFPSSAARSLHRRQFTSGITSVRPVIKHSLPRKSWNATSKPM